MRAAEATVSRAPNPMKIFPISEVWSRLALSLLARTGAGLGAATAAGGDDAGASCWAVCG